MGYFIGADREIPDCPLSITFLGKVVIAISLGVVLILAPDDSLGPVISFLMVPIWLKSKTFG